jgi:hypothetical protein
MSYSSLIDVSRYRSRSRKSEAPEGSNTKTIIPAGQPYLTKVNGKLVMAREKKPKVAKAAMVLLGDAFVARTVVRRRSKSVEPQAVPILWNTTTVNPTQAPVLPYSNPLPQQPFQPFNPYLQPPQGYPQQCMPPILTPCNPSLPQYPIQPQRYIVPQPIQALQPSKEDLESLKRIDAHFNEITRMKNKCLSGGPSAETKVLEENTIKTTVNITSHVCANCRRPRSRRYHAENPIKAGETPTPALCRKCKKHSSETSDSDAPKNPKSPEDKEKKENKKPKKKYRVR